MRSETVPRGPKLDRLRPPGLVGRGNHPLRMSAVGGLPIASADGPQAWLYGIYVHELPAVWPMIEHYVAAALRDYAHRWTIADVLDRCLSRDAQLWLMVTAPHGLIAGVLVTEIYDTAAGKTAALPVVACEDLAAALPLLETIEEWAKAHGCVRLEGMGRAGWERALKPFGWTKQMTIVEKRL